MKKRIVLSAVVAAVMTGAAPAQHPDEEEYGERVYFLADGNFATGNYLDYFQRPFAGVQKRNVEGYKGYVCTVHYGTTRPMRVEPGATYRLSFKVFNAGARHENPKKRLDTAPLPGSVFFLKGGDGKEGWKTVKSITHRTKDAEKAFLNMAVPGPVWTDVERVITVPEGSTMVTFGFGYSRDTNWGPFHLAEMKLEKVAADAK